MNAPRIFIATPMYGGQCYGTYVQGMLKFQGLCSQLQWHTSVSMMFNESLITRARNALVQNFLKSDCTHLLFIDADIRFNPEEIPRMVEVDKDVICGIYPKKEINWAGVRAAIEAGKSDKELSASTGSFVINLVNYDGSVTVPLLEPVEIWNGGTGFMLIKREVFEKMKTVVPVYRNDVVDMSGNMGLREEIHEFFSTSIEPGTERLLSEDYHFCHVWRTKCEGKVWAAPWVRLSHHGSYVFEGEMIRNVPSAPENAEQTGGGADNGQQDAPNPD